MINKAHMSLFRQLRPAPKAFATACTIVCLQVITLPANSEPRSAKPISAKEYRTARARGEEPAHPHRPETMRNETARGNGSRAKRKQAATTDPGPRTANRHEGRKRQETNLLYGSRGNADRALVFTAASTKRNHLDHRDKKPGKRASHGRYGNGYRDDRCDQRRYRKQGGFKHSVPYPGWVMPSRVYRERDTVWVSFSTLNHQADWHSYLADFGLFSGEFKTRTRHLSDPVIYVNEHVDAIELKGIKRDLHVRQAWMVLGNGHHVRLHDLEGDMDVGLSRAVFLSQDRYVQHIELQVEPVG